MAITDSRYHDVLARLQAAAARFGRPLPRLLAVSRLTDQAELESVAVRGEHADAAVAA